MPISLVARSKGGVSNAPERAVPHNRFAHIQVVLDLLDRGRADIEDHLVGRDRVDQNRLGFDICLKLRRDHHVFRQQDMTAALLGLGGNRLRGLIHVGLGNRGADLDAARGKERVRHAAAQDKDVHFAK